MNTTDLHNIFKSIPLLENMQPTDFEIRPLAGLSNNNFYLRNSTSDYVLRVPKPETNYYINRAFEAFNVDRATALGLAPEVLWRNSKGLSLTRCCTNSTTASISRMQDVTFWPLLVERLGVLHCSDIQFKGEVNLSDLLYRYFDLTPQDLKPKLKPYLNKASDLYANRQKLDSHLVPSHNDLVLENLLIESEPKLWMIDWEYSAMASPYWDIATLCNAARLNSTQTQALLDLYSTQVFELELDILRQYQYMLQVLAIGWLAAFSTNALDSDIIWLSQLEI